MVSEQGQALYSINPQINNIIKIINFFSFWIIYLGVPLGLFPKII